MSSADAIDPADRLDFAGEAEDDPARPRAAPWKVMIVDDDLGVHEATRLALRNVVFRGRPLEFVDAFSATEACRLLQEHDDVAVIFLDVVMESDDAGLKAVRQIREDGHALVRIVLRTGHPGYAPEREVVLNYDIHDYKEKTTLDYHKLFSCLISALRAYADLLSIEQHRRGLLSVLEAVSWFDFRSLQRYLSRMLAELSAIADIDIENLVLAVRSRKLLGATGDQGVPFLRLVDCMAGQPLAEVETRFIADAFEGGQTGRGRGPQGSTFRATAFGVDLVVFSRDPDAMGQADAVLLELFLTKVAQALDNHGTFSAILSERDRLIRGFVMQGERWGGHDTDEVARMQDLARRTAARLQSRLAFPAEIDDWFVFSIPTASSLHDLGLSEVPHRLFEQATPLTAAERDIVRGHIEAGVAMLRERLAGLLDGRLHAMAEAVIRQHHERHDGSGYPAGLAGDAIALPARIVGVVDSFVAMTAKRPWREALSADEALRFIRENRGRLFDPRVADAFLEAVDESD